MIRCRKISVVLLLVLVCFQTASADWTKKNVNTLAWLTDIHFFDAQRGIITGSGGTYLETTDGGARWTKREKITGDKILQIYFTDAFNGWLLCERDPFSRGAAAVSYLLKTTDGGANWETVEFKDAGRVRLTKIFFNQQGKGFAVGESGAVFELGGDGVWRRAASPARYLLLAGAFSSVARGALVGAAGSVFFTEDAGASWNRASISGKSGAKLNALFFPDPKNGWAVGAEGKILQTMSGGKTWREQPSGVSVDLRSVFFRNTAEGWAIGDRGTILHTRTGGNIWTLEETGTRHRLEKIVFHGTKGFAVGFGGTILVYGEAASIVPPAVKPVLQKRNQ